MAHGNQPRNWWALLVALSVAMFHPTSFVGWGVRRAGGSNTASLCKSNDRVQHFCKPTTIDLANYRDDFYQVAKEDAETMGEEVDAYLEAVLRSARAHIKSGVLVDRQEFLDSLLSAMTAEGMLTLVLGGKNFGKSLVLTKAIKNVTSRHDSNFVVAAVDMRGNRRTDLLPALEMELQNLLGTKWQDSILDVLVATAGLFLAAQSSGGPASVPAATAFRNLIGQGLPQGCERLIDVLISKQKFPVIVIDEANRGLPGQGGQDFASDALALFVKLCKQKQKANVILVSSEYGYPSRLQELGVNLNDINRVIIAPEIPEGEMLGMLKNQWAMGEGLAKVFFKFYGGLIYTSKMALEMLKQEGSGFYPFSVMEFENLQVCLKNGAARQHLSNIADRGYSLVNDVVSDQGARLIVKSELGGIISRRAQTFGLAPIFRESTCDFALIPSSCHVRLRIALALAQARELGPWWSRWLRWFPRRRDETSS